jgi:SAM-dependent methyltransferase
LYNSRPQASLIAGVDISRQAIEAAMERLRKIGSNKRLILKNVKMEDMFLDSELEDIKFDLISCFYGLYYSANVNNTILSMMEHVSRGGTIFIVGPYGNNNASLFDLLSRHFKLPELVSRSSKTFMDEEVLPLLSKKHEIRQEVFVNRIHYPTAEALINYWKASTFYFLEFEYEVSKEINKYFSHHKEFVVEKHVMAIIAKRKV